MHARTHCTHAYTGVSTLPSDTVTGVVNQTFGGAYNKTARISSKTYSCQALLPPCSLTIKLFADKVCAHVCTHICTHVYAYADAYPHICTCVYTHVHAHGPQPDLCISLCVLMDMPVCVSVNAQILYTCSHKQLCMQCVHVHSHVARVFIGGDSQICRAIPVSVCVHLDQY